MSMYVLIGIDGAEVKRPHGYGWPWDGPLEPAGLRERWGTTHVAARFDNADLSSMLDHWRREIRACAGYEVERVDRVRTNYGRGGRVLRAHMRDPRTGNRGTVLLVAR